MNFEPRQLFFFTRSFVILFLILRHSVSQVDAAGSNDTGDDQACKDLKKPNGEGKFDILCVGMVRKKMILVTTSWMVYDVPMDSLSSAINKLYLNGSKPVPLEQKWPKLFKSGQYQDSYKDMYNCFSAVDSGGDYLIGTVLIGHGHGQGTQGWMYGLSNEAVSFGFTYDKPDIQVLISSNELQSFYAINHGKDNSDKGIRIMRYHFDGQSVMFSRSIKPDAMDTFYRLCKVGKSEMKMVKGESEACDSLIWPVLKGFIADGHFYLFGGDYIFTFPTAVYEKDNVPVTFQSIPMNDFIQCSGNISDEARVAATTSGITWGIIIAIILLIVIALLICILCLMREAQKKKKKQEKEARKHDGGSSLKHSHGGAGGGGQSARSVGVDPFGQLSNNKNPSKKRSRKRSKRSARSGKYGHLTAKCPGDKKASHSAGHSARSGNREKPLLLTAANHQIDKSTRSSSKQKGKSRSRGGQSGSARSGNVGKARKISRKGNSAKHSAGRNDLTNRTALK